MESSQGPVIIWKGGWGGGAVTIRGEDSEEEKKKDT